MNVSWDKYFRYTECPQAYSWDYVSVQKSSRAGSEDTQYLVKGNATQYLVGCFLLMKDIPWERSQQCISEYIKDYLDTYTRLAVQRHWNDDYARGTPNTSLQEMVNQIVEKLTHTLPLLVIHIYNVCGGAPPARVLAETDIASLIIITDRTRDLEFVLQARTDVQIITPSNKLFIYEGKNTKYVKKANSHQVWWQAAILQGDSRIPLATHHFFVFYQTGEIRDIPISGDSGQPYLDWCRVERRDNLLGIHNGNTKATPESTICRLCSHRYRCPDVYKSKAAIEPIQPTTGVINNIF